VAQQWLVSTWDTVLAAFVAEVGRAGTRAEQDNPAPAP
jgi:hypothetical protein